LTPSKAFSCGSENPPLWECLWNNIKQASQQASFTSCFFYHQIRHGSC
jgi:hypothetical protein